LGTSKNLNPLISLENLMRKNRFCLLFFISRICSGIKGMKSERNSVLRYLAAIKPRSLIGYLVCSFWYSKKNWETMFSRKSDSYT
jgi:hypothetical protein